MNTLIPINTTLLQRAVAPGASEEECLLLMHLSQKYGLDPLAGELYLLRERNGKPSYYTSRDGYLKIANSHPAFSGMRSGVVRVGDELLHNEDGSVTHVYGTERGDIIGAYCVVYRSDRQYPAYAFAEFAEYNRPNHNNWKQYPTAMIQKVAEAMALKRAFSINGLVTKEEMESKEDAGVAFASLMQLTLSLLAAPEFTQEEREKYVGFLEKLKEVDKLKTHYERIQSELKKRQQQAA